MENSLQLISRAISMSKMETFRAYKAMEEDETEEKRMNKTIINNKMDILYYIEWNYTNWKH